MSRTWQQLEPVNWRLVVRAEKVQKEEYSAGGILLETEVDAEYRQSGMCEGHIVKVGPVAGKYVYWPDEKPQEYKVGEKIQYYRYAGVPIKGIEDGYDYRFIQDSDVQGKISGEEIEL